MLEKRLAVVLTAILLITVASLSFGQTSIRPELPEFGNLAGVSNAGEVLGYNGGSSYWYWSEENGLTQYFAPSSDVNCQQVFGMSDNHEVVGTCQVAKIGFTTGASFDVVAGQDIDIFGNVLLAADVDGDTLEAFRDSSYVFRNDSLFVWNRYFSSWFTPSIYIDGDSFWVKGDSLSYARVPARFVDGTIEQMDIFVDSTRTNTTNTTLGEAYSITNDGTIVVGKVLQNSDVSKAFVWDETNGSVVLPSLADQDHVNTSAMEIAGNGSLIVGIHYIDPATPDSPWDDKPFIAMWEMVDDEWVVDTLGYWSEAIVGLNQSLGSDAWNRSINSDGTFFTGYAESPGISGNTGFGIKYDVVNDVITEIPDQNWCMPAIGLGESPRLIDDFGNLYGSLQYGDFMTTYYVGWMYTEEDGIVDLQGILEDGGVSSTNSGMIMQDVSPSGKYILAKYVEGWNPADIQLITMAPPNPDTLITELVNPDTIRMEWTGSYHEGSTFNLQIRVRYAGSDYWTEYYPLVEDLADPTYDYIVEEPGTYQFMVSAVSNFWGGVESNWVEGLEVDVLDAPSAPADFSATYDLENVAVDLAWADTADDETGYLLQRSMMDDEGNWGAWEEAADLDADVVSYTDDTVVAGNVYSYRVQASGTRIGSIWVESNEVIVEILPLAPSDLAAIFEVEAGEVTLTWTDNSDNEDTFVLERGIELIGGEFGGWALAVEVDADVVTFVDTEVAWENNYAYRLKSQNVIGSSDWITVEMRVSDIVEAGSMLPTESRITGNYPNPFNGTTTVAFDLHKDANIQLKVYSIDGRLVAEPIAERRVAGSHRIALDLELLASGTYFLQLKGDSFTSMQKIVLLK